MLHEPALQTGEDNASAYKARLGVWMFLLYAIIYAGFVVINLTNAELMEKVVVLGLNLAVVYGFGLIIFALALALVYSHLCSRKERLLNRDVKNEEGE